MSVTGSAWQKYLVGLAGTTARINISDKANMMYNNSLCTKQSLVSRFQVYFRTLVMQVSVLVYFS